MHHNLHQRYDRGSKEDLHRLSDTRVSQLGARLSEFGARDSKFGAKASEIGKWASELGTRAPDLGAQRTQEVAETKNLLQQRNKRRGEPEGTLSNNKHKVAVRSEKKNTRTLKENDAVEVAGQYYSKDSQHLAHIYNEYAVTYSKGPQTHCHRRNGDGESEDPGSSKRRQSIYQKPGTAVLEPKQKEDRQGDTKICGEGTQLHRNPKSHKNEDPMHTSVGGNGCKPGEFGECGGQVHAGEAKNKCETGDLRKTTEAGVVAGLGERIRHRINTTTKPKIRLKKSRAEGGEDHARAITVTEAGKTAKQVGERRTEAPVCLSTWGMKGDRAIAVTE